MIPDHLLNSLSKLGGYVFNPVSPKTLLDNNVFKNGIKFGLAADDEAPLYIVGFAANRVFKKYETSETLKDRLQPIEDFNVGFPYDSILPMSFVAIYGDGAFTGKTLRKDKMTFEAMYLKEDTTRLLESLMKVAGVKMVIDKYTPATAIARRLEKFSLSECFPQKEAPAEKPAEAPVANPDKPIELSRKEILELLQSEKERIIREDSENPYLAKTRDSRRLIAMYDAVIANYKWHIKQNDDHKLVRMADGSRKWMPKDKAAELLKLPRDKRV